MPATVSICLLSQLLQLGSPLPAIGAERERMPVTAIFD